MKKTYRWAYVSSVLCVIAALVVSSVFYNRYIHYKEVNDQTYFSLIDSAYGYGLEIPEFKINKIAELIHNDSPDAREGIESWILEIASDYSVAENSAVLAQRYFRPAENAQEPPVLMYQFFGGLKSVLLDMIRTNDDLEQWKQVGLELQGMMLYLITYVNKNDLRDKSLAAEHWHSVVMQMKQRYSDSYIVQHMSI